MADRVSKRDKRKTVQFRGMFVWIIVFYFYIIFLPICIFITNGYKHFLKTNSTDPRQRVTLTSTPGRPRSIDQAPMADEHAVIDLRRDYNLTSFWLQRYLHPFPPGVRKNTQIEQTDNVFVYEIDTFLNVKENLSGFSNGSRT